MLRVTSNMMNSQLLLNLNRNAAQMNNTQNQMSTGRKINKPSDDPVGITYSLRYRSELASTEQYKKNVDSATSWMDFNDTVLNQVTEVVHRLRELTVKASTGSNPQSALDSINVEIAQMKEQLLDIANSQLNGKYVFNGEKFDAKPYGTLLPDGTVTDPSQITTDTGAVKYTVGDSVDMTINLTGNNVFGDADDAVSAQTSDNLFSIVNRLIDKLGPDGDHTKITDELASLDSRMNILLTTRAEVGAKMNRISLMQGRLEDLEANLTTLQAKTEDADYAKLIMDSKIQENIYNASLSAGSKIIQQSLVDFLR
ncbi:flagellar hook-associated protein FlgL [Paenibacillus nasutitermitis]|uniref:Flagellar hook-associated protein FlgL n=1 Tax=Paenibacillus nasutitermitis TaxID=1652958 RepID=A0A917E0Q6_9BACL|nr:flagellar hook-associated protein FlgL [Paenibacillus nasutitermitis]GGD92251.1 flagellar hook-associated protein FlgL [Paenibacillus nasutitermitis]